MLLCREYRTVGDIYVCLCSVVDSLLNSLMDILHPLFLNLCQQKTHIKAKRKRRSRTMVDRLPSHRPPIPPQRFLPRRLRFRRGHQPIQTPSPRQGHQIRRDRCTQTCRTALRRTIGECIVCEREWDTDGTQNE